MFIVSGIEGCEFLFKVSEIIAHINVCVIILNKCERVLLSVKENLLINKWLSYITHLLHDQQSESLDGYTQLYMESLRRFLVLTDILDL